MPPMLRRPQVASVQKQASFRLTTSSKNPHELFDLQEELGRGAFGSVHKGLNKENSKTVAIKLIDLVRDYSAHPDEIFTILSSQHVEGEKELDGVKKEIEILRRCDDKNVTGYFGAFVDNEENTLWIVMEYCGGGSVRAIIDIMRKPLPEAFIAFVCRESLKGLQYLHSQKIIHRDIKGGNILLSDDGEVKLADFGVSASLNNTESKRNTSVGTPFWMAPEMISDTAYNKKIDVWALGITALEMAEMNPPHHQVHPMKVLFEIPRNPSPTLSDPSKWSKEFSDFLSQCLVKDPSKRPEPADLLNANLSKLIAKSVIDEMRVIKESMPDEPEDDEDDDHFLNDDTILDDDNGMLLESEDDDLDDFAMPAQPVKAPTPSAPMPTPSSKPPSSLKIVDADDDDNEEDHMQTIAVVPKLPVVSFTVPPADDLLLRGFTAILHQDKGTPRSVLVIVFKESCSRSISNILYKIDKMQRTMLALRDVDRVVVGLETKPFKRAIKHGIDCCLSVIMDEEEEGKLKSLDLEFKTPQERDVYCNVKRILIKRLEIIQRGTR